LLARSLDVAPSSIRIVSGAASRRKVIELDGLDPAVLRSRWPGLAV
jgi:uncharacterized protein YggU (UPF0235/DUF167 family)